MRQGQVWVIKTNPKTPPEGARRTTPTAAPRSAPVRSTADPPGDVVGTNKSWKRVVLAYLLGPVLVVSQVPGRSRLLWALLGPVSAAAAIALAVTGSRVTRWFETIPYGAALWLLAFPLVILLVATAWARCIAAAGRHRPRPTSMYRPWMRDPRAVGFLGLVVPGLGLLLAGRRLRAAWAFWTVGPLAASAVILLHWRWLWTRSLADVPPGISGDALEGALLAAVVVFVVSALAWIVQALDGARRVGGETRRVRPDLVSAALVVTLALFALTARPASFARNLDLVSAGLQVEGLRVIPLGLSEIAIRLAPSDPGYLARAAELNEQLGMRNAAFGRRLILQHRARQYMEAVGIPVPETAGSGDAAGAAPNVVSAGIGTETSPWHGVSALYK